MAKESGHHQYGPSALDALSQCVRFKYNDSDDDAATEGTLLHKAFETGDLAGLDDEQKQCVTAIRGYAESLKYENGASPADWEDLAETGIALEGLTFGTPDRVLINRKQRLAHVIDAKYTRLDKEHGMQLRTYGAAIVEKYPGEIDTVETHVVAPRLGRTDRERHCAPVLVKAVRDHIEALYARIEDPFTPPTPCEDLCGKCARASKCPAFSKAVTAVSRGIGLPLPSMFAPNAIVSLRDRAVAQVLAGALTNWSEQVKSANLEFVAGGGEIPGYRLTRRSTGMRVPKERTGEALALLQVAGVSPEAAIGCCSLTIGDVVSAVSFACGVPESVAKDQVRAALADVAREGFCQFLSKENRVSDDALMLQVTAG